MSQPQPVPEEPVAMLIAPGDYLRQLNQVAGVTTRNVVFLKRKFVSRTGHELVLRPIETCTRVRYHDERPLATLVSGALLVLVMAVIVGFLIVSWNDLTPGTRVPIGALGLALLYGVRRVLGARRHRLVFTFSDRASLRWTSRPGEYDVYKASVDRVLEFASARGILDASRLVRT